MAKTPFSKLWLRGLKRLVELNAATILPRSPARKPGRGARPAPRAKPFGRGARTSKPSPAHSLVGWASRETDGWRRSFYSAPPGPLQLVNHLSYGLYLPNKSDGRPMPLVVMLHGCKQTADDFARGTAMNALAERHGFAVLYPEQSPRKHPHRCWHWYDDGDSAGGLEAQSIASLVEQTVATHGLDATRVYVAGLSAGAGMATLLAIRYPQLFAALGTHSGVAFGAANSAIGGLSVMRRGARADPVALIDNALGERSFPGMPAIFVHGAQDAVVDPVNVDQLALQWLRINGMADAQGTLVGATVLDTPFESGERRDYARGRRVVVRVCRIAGLGHAWSGGDGSVEFHSGTGPQASELMWSFFRTQRRTSQGVVESIDTAPANEARAAAVATELDAPDRGWPFGS